uniref:Cytochrome b n=1 Tax=Scutopus ventrolineatus TaxID=52922 RepID=A0A096XEB8_SCUVE|nr:cytochrome b [Scutopus ventrolineatus]AHI45700.1 cytochrome b [Scutopus ventrolineatus]
MFKPFRKNDPALNLLNKVMVDLPSPSSISLWWNLGSLLGLCLAIQIASGIFLSFHYCVSVDQSFDSVVHIVQEAMWGWTLRALHVNGGTCFFVCLYIHMGRGLYYGNYANFHTWASGVVLFILTMATAFLGYILPWGQMSFWGATVITSLFSAVPYIGSELVEWLWGGFSVGGPTLVRFYSLHFIVPFIIAGLTMIHLLYLHQGGSKNPLGLSSDVDKIPFHPYYSVKDILGFVFVLFFLIYLSFFYPYMLCEADNFLDANPLVTPTHIQPEWYFLFVYAILRAVPNKLGGVVALVSSLLIFFLVPYLHLGKFQGMSLYPLSQLLFWSFVGNFFLLTWIGARPVEDPYIFLGQVFSLYYFMFFFLNPIFQKVSDLTYQKSV